MNAPKTISATVVPTVTQTWLFTMPAPLLCVIGVLGSGKSPGRIVVCGRLGKSEGSCAGSVIVVCTFACVVVNPGFEVGCAGALEGAAGAVALGLGFDEGDAAGELPLTVGLVEEGLTLLGDETGIDALGDALLGVPDGTVTSGRLNPLQLVLNAATRRLAFAKCV